MMDGLLAVACLLGLVVLAGASVLVLALACCFVIGIIVAGAEWLR